MSANVFILFFLGFLVEPKININKVYFIAHMTTTANSKNGFESRVPASLFLFRLPFFVIGEFSPVITPHWMQEKCATMYNVHCTVHGIGDFRNNFQDYRRLSEQLLAGTIFQRGFQKNKSVFPQKLAKTTDLISSQKRRNKKFKTIGAIQKM